MFRNRLLQFSDTTDTKIEELAKNAISPTMADPLVCSESSDSIIVQLGKFDTK